MHLCFAFCIEISVCAMHGSVCFDHWRLEQGAGNQDTGVLSQLWEGNSFQLTGGEQPLSDPTHALHLSLVQQFPSCGSQQQWIGSQ